MFIALRKGHILELFLRTSEHCSTALHFAVLFLFPRVIGKTKDQEWSDTEKNRRWASIQPWPAIKILSYWLYIDIRKSIKCCCGQYVSDIVQVRNTLAKHPNEWQNPTELQKYPPATRTGHSYILISQQRLLTAVMERHHQEKSLFKGRWHLLKSPKNLNR